MPTGIQWKPPQMPAEIERHTTGYADWRRLQNPGSLRKYSVKRWGQERLDKAELDKFVEELDDKLESYGGR